MLMDWAVSLAVRWRLIPQGYGGGEERIEVGIGLRVCEGYYRTVTSDVSNGFPDTFGK